jgi:RNA-directed DNA polymerase
MWLKVPVEERDAQGRRRMTGGKRSTRGTPQGGVISPLLANIYMHRFLRAWRQRDKGRQYRARLIAYADDFVIVSRGQAAAALAWTRDVMTRIGLSLNDAKTSIRNARTETFDFLGYTLGSAVAPVDGHWYLAARPSKKSLQRVKGTVRGVLASGNQQPWPQVVADLNRRLRGWANYFNYGSCAQAYDAVDHYVTAAVRPKESHDVREEVARTVIQHGWPLREIRLEHATLEEFFVQVTANQAVAKSEA